MINHPLVFNNLNETIFILRKKARENGIGELFIFSPLNIKFKESEYRALFDAIYDFPIMNLLEENSNKQNIGYYTRIIYKNIIFNNIYNNYNNISFYRTSFLQFYNNSINGLFKDYSI